jgi:hypothetical protein
MHPCNHATMQPCNHAILLDPLENYTVQGLPAPGRSASLLAVQSRRASLDLTV